MNDAAVALMHISSFSRVIGFTGFDVVEDRFGLLYL